MRGCRFCPLADLYYLCRMLVNSPQPERMTQNITLLSPNDKQGNYENRTGKERTRTRHRAAHNAGNDR